MSLHDHHRTAGFKEPRIDQRHADWQVMDNSVSTLGVQHDANRTEDIPDIAKHRPVLNI